MESPRPRGVEFAAISNYSGSPEGAGEELKREVCFGSFMRKVREGRYVPFQKSFSKFVVST